MINQLIPGEITVLRALSDQRPKWSTELAEETHLAPFTVRSICKALCRRRLVARGHHISDAGSYTITEYGLLELNRISQLRLIGGRDVA